MRGRNIRIVREILRGIERQRGNAALLPADLIELDQRIDAGSPHVGIGGKIDRGREKCVRITAFMPAGVVVVLIRIRVRVPDVVIVRVIEQVVDQRIAIIVVHGAVGELVSFESAEYSVARRPVDGDVIAGPSDGRVDQAETECDRVVAQAGIDRRTAGWCRVAVVTGRALRGADCDAQRGADLAAERVLRRIADRIDAGEKGGRRVSCRSHPPRTGSCRPGSSQRFR